MTVSEPVNDPTPFPGTGVSLPSAVAPRRSLSDTALVLIIRAACFVGLLLANYYGWTMTATGFVNTQLLPDNSVISNTYTPHLVAGFVQLGMLAVYLSIPYFQRRLILASVVACCFAVSLAVLSALFALFSITFTSQSDNIFRYQVSLLQEMDQRVHALDKVMSAAFAGYINSLDLLAQRACEGKDRTGIAKCGQIYRSFIDKANAARSTYQAQLGGHGTYDSLNTQDIAVGVTLLRGNYARLLQKVDAYERFAKDNAQPYHTVIGQVEALARDIDTFSSSLNQRAPDKKTLVIARVLDDVKKSWRGTAEPLVYFSLVISFLPDMLSITFTAILLIMRAANHEAAAMRRAVRKTHEEANWYAKYATAMGRLRAARGDYHDQQRMADLEDNLDDVITSIRARPRR